MGDIYSTILKDNSTIISPEEAKIFSFTIYFNSVKINRDMSNHYSSCFIYHFYSVKGILRVSDYGQNG